jgi:uncharacterized protein
MSKVLITGATEGIGLSFAKYYSSIGDEVYLVARNRMRMIDVKKQLEDTYHNKVYMIIQDLSVVGTASQLYESVNDEIDILINNAGVGYTERSWKIDIDKEESMVVLNDATLMSLTKLYANDMKKRHSGMIINIASTGAFQPGPYIAGYYASKSFVVSYTRALHEELKQYGIHVYCVCPGPVDTDFYLKSGTNSPRYAMNPDKVVKYTIKHMKKKCMIIPGFLNRFVRIFPESIRMYFVKKSKWKKIQKKKNS